ncbi:MAG: ABC transporter permease [Pyrinomonadaceae bacterium]|nr:ABC transporter permease [Pyrinomonadaceae bacterium]
MQTAQLLKRNLAYYWRTNLAVIAGVATAVAVLACALLVGDSVRGSLRDLFLQRLGNTDQVIASNGFFREQLAADIQSDEQFHAGGLAATTPLIALEGTITHEASKRLGSGVRVYGVDERFWKFHGRENRAPINREILVSEGLARELGSTAGDALLLRVQKPSEIPVESLHSKKEDLGRTLRLAMREALSSEALGEFSLQPQQAETRAVFVPLKLLQRELEQEGRANLILVNEGSVGEAGSETQSGKIDVLDRILKSTASLEDYGIKLRVLDEQQELSIESSAGFISQELRKRVEIAAQSAETTGAWPFLSYLVNAIRKDDGREIPYSIVTSVDSKLLEFMQHDERGHFSGCDASLPAGSGSVPATAHLPPMMLNEWAGSDLKVKIGDRVTLDYYVWLEEGKLATRSTEFRVACIIPMKGIAADRDLVPDYPGITESETLGDWDPPFPIDLKRVRPQDEDYWKKYRTTPKGFIPLTVGQQLWQTRFGNLTSLRVSPKRGGTLAETRQAFERSLRETLDPLQAGFSILPVRAQGLEASRGATNFGEYFLYFSFFLVVSALLLTALFFKLGIEQRLREIGLLQAVGFPASRVRKLFLFEGIVLAVVGSLIGLVGAVAYGQLMMTGLSTWWVQAVGTTMLKLNIAPASLLLGAVGGVIAALVCIIWTLRQLGRESTRSLLSGTLARDAGTTGPRGDSEKRRRGDGKTGRTENTAPMEHSEGSTPLPVSPSPLLPASPSPLLPFSLSPRLLIASLLTLLGLALLLLASFKVIGQTPGFFGGGVLLLTALLCYQSAWLRAHTGKSISGTGWWPVARLGFRNATNRPGRSVLCIALIASAAFIIVSVDAFRRRSGTEVLDRKSGNGGFPLLAESLLPLVHDPNAGEGREALNLSAEDSSSTLSNVTFTRFRVRPGDDASCLNLYQPRNPRIIAPNDEFIRSNRFAFANSLADSREEKENPWLLLNREFQDGAIPVIGDANSMTYVMHLKLGEDFVLNRETGPIRLRLVGTLSDSVFQSELLMAEKNFLHLFPEQEGYRFFLIDTPAGGESSKIAATLEDRLGDFGFDVVPTSERLANFHRVENTYLSTFQMLGGLGLLLGTLGLAAVLLRNVLERRRELALLRAVGYNSSHFTLMVVAENALLLFSGLFTGTVCALLAIAPVFFERGGRLPNISLGLLLLAVLISGLIASLLATWAALRSPLLPALRAE